LVTKVSVLSFPGILAVAIAIFLFSAGHTPVAAQGGDQIPSSAQVQSTTALVPVIECKWELVDTVVNFVDGTYPQDHSELDPLNDPDIPYGFNIPNGAVQYGQDDDPLTTPSTSPACTRSGGQSLPTQPDGVQHMIQVMPVAEDDPEERIIQNWAAVDHPAGVNAIDDVFWKIFHSDGSFKYQIHGHRVPVSEVDLLGAWNQPGTMWGAAHTTGQVSQGAIHAADYGMIDRVKQQQKTLWYADWLISKDQMCGEYRIEAHAVANGVEAIMTNYIDIICFYNLEIDFSSVNWGAILPGTSKVVPGDTQFSPPNSSAPTVKNTGNSGMQVGVRFSPLVQQGVQGPKQIVDFDAAFGKSASVLQWIDPISANTDIWFNNSSINQVLCANQIGKLDLSIHPPAGLPNGQYAGVVTVLANWAPGVCPNDIAAGILEE
jgi:hypothetical protein